MPELIGCLVNARNIFEFLEEKEEPENWYKNRDAKDGMEKAKSETDREKTEAEQRKKETDVPMLKLDEIEFYYREDKPLLKDFSMAVEKGESVAITGPSGCGKTTVSKLLLSLYPLVGGEWFLGNGSCYDLSNNEIRKQIAYVPQEPYLFNESVRENIRIKIDLKAIYIVV